MTNRLLPVNASMKSATSRAPRMPRRESAGELQPGDPALGALLERVHVGGGEVEPHHLVEERHGPRVRRQPQVGGPDLGELATTAQPGQGEGRVGAGRQHQVQLGGKVVEEEGHRLVHLGRARWRGSRRAPGPTASPAPRSAARVTSLTSTVKASEIAGPWGSSSDRVDVEADTSEAQPSGASGSGPGRRRPRRATARRPGCSGDVRRGGRASRRAPWSCRIPPALTPG